MRRLESGDLSSKRLDLPICGLFHLAKTRAAVELTSISNMPYSRALLATGMQCTPSCLQPLHVTKFSKLTEAVHKVLKRFSTDPKIEMDMPADAWFREYILPHVNSSDGYVLAATAALAICLAAHRLDLVIAGLFGAGIAL